MSDVIQFTTIGLIAFSLVLLILVLRRTHQLGNDPLVAQVERMLSAQDRLERTLREELAQGRAEMSGGAKAQRAELGEAFKLFGDAVKERTQHAAETQKAQLQAFSEQLDSMARTMRERLDVARAESAEASKQLREEVVGNLAKISDAITSTLRGLAQAQQGQLEAFAGQLRSFAQTSSDKLDGVRSESTSAAKQLREEVIGTLTIISETTAQAIKDLGRAETAQLETFSIQMAALIKTTGEKLDGSRNESTAAAKQLREEVVASLTAIASTLTATATELANSQKSQLELMSSAITRLSEANDSRFDALRVAVETKLGAIQLENAKQLEQMRQTVDEKLQGTLDRRLGESFKQVSERLEQVHKGLGEMQVLATGVGDLKRVLTNVKTRGTWGEVQLGTLLEQALTADQFARNVSTKEASERVEFAIKLPGQGNPDDTVWLPIDAKFPVEDYQRLLDAQDSADSEAMEAASKQLEARVKACAKHICDKYLNPPYTTDFGILFLPTEGLFAEVIRRTGLTEVIQRECRIVIAGPTTLWSILNSLQMGFRTLAIQKRSSEVWNLLAAVKTEWSRYGDILDAVQRKLHQANETIEKAKVRSRAVGRKLRDVQELPSADAAMLLPLRTTAEPGDDAAADAELA